MLQTSQCAEGSEWCYRCQVQVCRKAAEFGLTNLTFQQGDAEEIELGESSFDVITCSSAIIYLADVPAALVKLHRWLKPGGRLVFNTPQVNAVLKPVAI